MATPTLDDIASYRHVTWKWQRLMGVRLTTSHRNERKAGVAYAWIRDLWYRRGRDCVAACAERRRTGGLIHRRYEGRNDSGAPYYGGLQMDLSLPADLRRAISCATRGS
jgi:hypothetical protein